MRAATSFAIAALTILMIQCGGDARPSRDGGATGEELPDSGIGDSGVPDAGVVDAGIPDGGLPDSGGPDAGETDAGPTDHGQPTATLSSYAVDATLGVPVVLDASGSVDPDGRALTFAWTVASVPPGEHPILTGADTPTPSFTAIAEGSYALSVRVTATDGQSAVATLTLFAHHPLRDGETFIELLSEPGDFVGGARSYGYTQANARIVVAADGGHLNIAISGEELWNGNFQMPSAFDRIVPGTYEGLGRYPVHDPLSGGLDWSGLGRGCGGLTGSVTVDSATYTDGALTAIELRFEQRCGGWMPPLRGHVRWSAADPTRPPGPGSPPPGLWHAPEGATPASGNYVFLQSDEGDYVGRGLSFRHTPVDSLISISATGNGLSVQVHGDDTWSGFFVGMYSISELQAGYYGPFTTSSNAARGWLDWQGDGRGCGDPVAGWFVVDSVSHSGSTLTAIDLRFEQRCRAGIPALHGQIHWDASDTTGPPGPVQPPPDLWRAPSDATPAGRNYVYLESDPLDFIGQGEVVVYTQADSIISTFSSGNHLSMAVRGDQNWDGDFQGMSSVAQLVTGYYGKLQRYPFNNPTRGGLDWSGDGRGCNTLAGWFVIDGITYSGGAVTTFDLRFEQHCEGLPAALRGQIHWDVTDATKPPGPLQPPPQGLWQPPAGSTPATGNYIYLQSDVGDFVGAGGSYVYTPPDALMSVSSTGNFLAVRINGDQTWRGDFQGMNSIALLQPGYYGILERFPFHNQTKGGLSWGGELRGCNELYGWFVVDAVTYTDGALTALDLRFEQHCEFNLAALHGQVHWDTSNPTLPPGPIQPPPPGLWNPAPGSTPSSGDYLYLESDRDDPVGAGGTYTYTPPLEIGSSGNTVSVIVGGWHGYFQSMGFLADLQPGYYGNVGRYYGQNPARGGMFVYQERQCSGAITGWFVVDAVTYTNGALTALDLRFEQHCGDASPALRGQLHWAGP